MAETYDILCDGEPVGTARVEKAGLYRCFSCRCRLPDEGLYRVWVICGGKREDLGICVPMDGAFGTDRKVPAKRLGEGSLRFELLQKDRHPQEDSPQKEIPQEPEARFVPVSEEEPFEHLDKLEGAVLETRDGETGILLPETEELQRYDEIPET